MKILLYGINYYPELTGVGKYSGEFARWCTENGHQLRVVTAPAYYPNWKVSAEYSPYKYQVNVEHGIKVVRCPLYVPSKPTALRRVLHLLSFAISSFFALFSNVRWKPDLIVHVAPTMFSTVSTLLMSRLTNTANVLHIQDYEVDAMFGLAMVDGGIVRRMAYSIERAILRRFDSVSTISKGMVTRAINKGVDPARVIWFPNWAEVERFEHAKKSADLLANLGVDPEKEIVLYAGSMGEKQGLEIVLDAAASLSARDDVQFLFVGEGGAKRRLVSRCMDEDLDNVVFAPLQPYEVLPDLLASATCHLVIQKRGAADAVLPSKLTNILAVGGNAVITSDEDTSLGELALDWPGIAFLVEPESVSALVVGIDKALVSPSPNSIAIEYAREHLEKNKIIAAYLENFSA